MKRSAPEDLFWSKVDRSGECWLWQAFRDKDGYGMFSVTLPRDGLPRGVPTPQRRVRASHFAWETVNGPVPRGLYVLHSCDVPACVNPNHLRLGTARDNYYDAKSKGRHTHGERSRAILTTQDVIAILASSERDKVLARRYGVAPITINAVRCRRNWRHVEAPPRQPSLDFDGGM